MKTTRGFTLIELIVVMAILAILLAIGTSAFTTSLKKGRDNTRKANLRAITNALELYYNDNGKYPLGDTTNGYIIGCNTVLSRQPCTPNGPFKDITVPTNPTIYMGQLPTDPKSTQRYWYVSNNGTQYQIYAHMENDQDSTLLSPPTGYDCSYSGGLKYCNWGLSSGNTTP